MKSDEFSNIRHFLGKTQEQMAELLCVSTKAIQSYEQGWRRIPAHHEQQILLLLSLKRGTARNVKPCWEIKECPPEWRNNCIIWELKLKHFCWFFNGTFCQGGKHKSWDKKIKICQKCEVYRSMFPEI